MIHNQKCIIALAALLSPNLASAERYTIASLGSLGFFNRGPYDARSYSLNSEGHVLGQMTVGGKPRATIWSAGNLSPLGTWGAGTLSLGFAIDDSENVTGELDDSFGQHFAARKPFGGTWTSGLYPTGMAFTTPRGMNNIGQSVGIACAATFYAYPTRAYFQAATDGNTRPIIINQLPPFATAAAAFAISDSGYIAGNASFLNNPNDIQAVLWRRISSTQVSRIITGPPGSTALGVNEGGYHVGYMSTGAAAWTVAGINTLPAGTPGVATDINNSRVVVGNTIHSAPPTNASSRAYVVFPSEAYQDLNTLVVNGDGWVLWSASAINDAGQVVGYGSLNGTPRGFLLTPIPMGDLNCDGAVGLADIAPFTTALLDSEAYQGEFPSCEALGGDLSGDNLVDGDDIAEFLDLLMVSRGR